MKHRTDRYFRIVIALILVGGVSICCAGEEGFSFGGSAGKSEACLACHGDAGKVKGKLFIDQTQYGHTTHAKIGCPSCHDAVGKNHPLPTKTPRSDCRECHLEVGAEYGASIHAGKTDCSGCHDPHKAQTGREISGQQINKMCSGCHNGFEMTAKHGEWLPQAELHLRMLPCITCHTGAREYFISMYIVKGKNGSRFGRQELASYEDLRQAAGGKELLSLIDTNDDHFVSLEELRSFNRNPSHKELRLQGMMTPETVSHKFDILGSRRNCSFCHTSGPAPMQTSYIAIPEPNGTFSRIAVERGAVFDALYGAPDFYMMGSTKNSTLNRIGLALVCGGLIMPVGHGFLRFLTRKNRKGKEN